ncbi:MAG: ACT domain-containing protein [Gammaproteobacteria bacterium]|nr:ACT domain-containing protein [Gammaproteobacteria bacterium]MCP5299476.1 ACT domain-containing protein [Chromatiaceae bacterium]
MTREERYAFTWLPDRYCITRLPRGQRFDAAVLDTAAWYSLTRTDEELSVIAPSDIDFPSGQRQEGWRCLKMLGPLDFSLIGVMASVTTTLAEAGISVLTVSTYDTDYILVRDHQSESARQALLGAGHEVTRA